MRPSLSVVVVSDFEPSAKKSWRDEIRMARALSRQDVGIAFEVVIVESDVHRDEPVPDELYALLPELRLVFHDGTSSAELKDHGVSIAAGDWVAVFEADSTPEDDWLRLALDATRAHSYAVAVSGLTTYGSQTSYRRVMNLLDRSFNDTGASKEAFFISNNGALYRKDVLQRFPYPQAITPFHSARRRNLDMRQRGCRFYFERRARMTHAIGGWDFIWDAHANLGHMYMEMHPIRALHAIPALIVKQLWFDIKRYFWLGRLYLKWHDWPLATALLLLVRVPEVRGMLLSVRNASRLPGSAYR